MYTSTQIFNSRQSKRSTTKKIPAEGEMTLTLGDKKVPVAKGTCVTDVLERCC